MAQLVGALHHKPKGRGFDSRLSHWDFFFIQFLNSMAVGSTQTLTAMSTRNISCGVKAAGV